MIVCMSQLGELELWKEHDPKINYAWPAWTVTVGVSGGHDVIFGIYGTTDAPETFGREVLSEL
jgi:hypothetical protein